MLMWSLRVAGAVMALVAVIWIVNAVVAGMWQFWVAALSFTVISWAFFRMGSAARDHTMYQPLTREPGVLRAAIIAIIAFVAGALAMSTLG